MFIPSDKKIWEGIFTDSLIQNPKFWVPIMVAFIIGFGVSEQFLGSDSIISSIPLLLSDHVPAISKAAERSIFPNTTRFLFSYFLLVIPWFYWVIANHKKYEIHFVSVWQSGSKLIKYLRPVLLLVINAFFIFSSFYLALPEEPTCRRLCIYESRLLQVLFGFAIAFSTSMFLAMMFWWIKNFKKLTFNFR